ncbi:MAG: hypothetical protein AAF928_07555 [Myxococcota bacterium]
MRRTKLFLGTVGAITAVAMLASGCGDDVDGTGGGDGGDGPGTGGSDTTPTTTTTNPVVTTSTMGTGGMTPVPDESTSCADAVEIMAEQNGLMQPLYRLDDNVLGEPGDQDFFLIRGIEAGSWWQFSTDANPDDIPDNIDTVLTILSADGSTEIATVDDAYPRLSTDSEMFHRFAAAGDYCIRVEEFSAWSGGSPEGGPTFEYSVIGLPLDFTAYEQHNVDTEPNGDQGAADTNGDGSALAGAMAGISFANFAGLTDSSGDVDVFRFVAPASSIGLNLDLTSIDPANGYGSTGGPGLVKLYDSTFGLLAEVDAAKFDQGVDGMSGVPILAGETYYLSVEKPAGATVGANDFYFVKTFTTNASNPQEGGGNTTPSDDGTNDTFAGAEATMSDGPEAFPSGENVYTTFIGGELPEGDVDYWAFDTNADLQNGDEMTLVCSSWAVGSGVRGLQVTLEDGTGASVRTSIETETDGVLWSGAQGAPETAISIATANGPYRIRLENLAATADGAASATHYLCGIRRIFTP